MGAHKITKFSFAGSCVHGILITRTNWSLQPTSDMGASMYHNVIVACIYLFGHVHFSVYRSRRLRGLCVHITSGSCLVWDGGWVWFLEAGQLYGSLLCSCDEDESVCVTMPVSGSLSIPVAFCLQLCTHYQYRSCLTFDCTSRCWCHGLIFSFTRRVRLTSLYMYLYISALLAVRFGLIGDKNTVWALLNWLCPVIKLTLVAYPHQNEVWDSHHLWWNESQYISVCTRSMCYS